MPVSQPNLDLNLTEAENFFNITIVPLLKEKINFDEPLMDYQIYRTMIERKKEKLEQIRKLIKDLFLLQGCEDF
jgi:hypothetical protein